MATVRRRDMRQARRSIAPLALFALLAVGLLALSQLWHVPMMLWDHLDLVPIYTDVLAGIYFDQPEVAAQRLDALRELGFAPFEQ